MKSAAALSFFFSFFAAVAKAQPPPPPSNGFYFTHLRYLIGQIVIILSLTFAIYLSCKGLLYIYIRYFSAAAAAHSGLRRRAMADASAVQFQITVDGADSRGLDPSVIQSFPILKYSDVKHRRIGEEPLECAVCLTDFNKDDETLRLLPACDHAFHPSCIDCWLEARVTCPVCRASLIPDAEKPARVPPEVGIPVETANLGNDEEIVIQLVDDNQPPPGDPNATAPPVKPFGLGKFRSHSTGHSLNRSPPVENLERFTLRLPAEAWEELNRRYGIGGEGISDRRIKSDRWVFTGERSAVKTPHFRWLEFKGAERAVPISG